MSRQNKNIKQRTLAKQFTALHLRGEKGPAKTTATHGKINVQYSRITRGLKDMPKGRKREF